MWRSVAMVRQPLRATLLVGTTCGALLLGSGVSGAAAEAPTPRSDQPSARDAATDRQIAQASIEELRSGVTREGERTVTGELAPAPQLSLGLSTVAPARVGGAGVVEVGLLRRAEVGQPVRGVRVRIPAPRGGVIDKATGPGWRCATTSGAATCRLPRGGRLGGDLSPLPITVAVGVKESVRGGSMLPVQAMATWKGGGTTTTKKDPWQVRDRLSLLARPGLRLSLSSDHGPDIPLLTNSAARHRQFPLSAKIRNGDGAQVSATWTQVSGPKAQMLQPTKITHAQEQLSQVIQVPNRAKKATGRYTFALRASDADQTVRRKISVDVEAAAHDTKVEARHAQLHKLARKSDTGPLTWDQGSRQPAHPVHALVVKGPATAVSGRSVDFTAAVSGEVDSTTWSVAGLPERTATGESFSVKAPEAGETLLVRATTTMADGRVLESTRTLSGTGAAETDEVRAAGLGPVAKSALCKVVDGRNADGSLTTDNGFQLRWKAKALQLSSLDTPGVCSGTEVLNFRKSADVSIYYQDVQLFTNLTGKISAAGLQLTQAKWFLPAQFRKGLLKKTEGFDLFASEGPTQPRSPLVETSAGGWGDLEGFFVKESINADDAVVLLPLPNGWKAFGTTVSFLPEKPADLQGSRPVEPGTVEFAQNFRDLLPEGCTNPDPNAVLPQCASAKFSVDLVANKASTAEATLSNINIGQTAAGDSITASGQGTVDLAGKDSRLKVGISCGGKPTDKNGCELVKNLFLRDAWMEFSTLGQIRIYAAAEVPGNDPAKPYGFAVAGRYRAADNWRLDVSNTTPWALGAGITLTDLSGTIERRVEPGLESKAQLLAGIEAKVSDIPVSQTVKVDTIGATITNACVDRESLQEVLDCNPGELRVAFNLGITATLPGGAKPRMTMEGAYNFTTKRYRFSGGVADVAIGPEQFQVTEAKFSISNDGSSVCQSGTIDANDPNQDKFTLGLSAKGNVMGNVVAFTGSTNKDGLCLAASQSKASSLGNGMKVSDNLFAYTSYKEGATVRLPGRTPVLVKQDNVILTGQFEVPASVTEWLGAPEGRVVYTAKGDTSLKKLAFDINYQITKPVPIYTYRAEGQDKTRLELTKVGLQLNWQRNPVAGDLSLYASSNLFVEAAGSTPRSNTPISLAAALGFEGGQLTVGLRAGVETNGATKPIANAFGVEDLTVRNLAVAASISIPSLTPKISFDADMDLPGSWGPGAGLKSGIPVRLGFSFGDAAPCMVFSAGRESTPSNPAPVILDIANAGLLTARYAKFVIAPMGCSLPSGIGSSVEVPRGLAIAFDGSILGSDIQVNLSMAYANNGLQFKGNLKAYLDFKVISLKSYDGNGPARINIDIDTTPNNFKFVAEVDAGIEVGSPQYFGARIGVKGNFNYTPQDPFITANLVGEGSAAIGPIGSTIDLSLDLKLAKDTSDAEATKQSYANASAKMRAKVIGISVEAAGDLQYEASRMINLHLAAGVEVDIFVGAVKGTLAFDYCVGTLTAIKADGSGSRCQPYDKDRRTDATPTWRVGLTGYYRILWWKNDYTWNIYESIGKQGTLDPAKDPDSSVNLAADVPATSPVTLSMGRQRGNSGDPARLGEVDYTGPLVPYGAAPDGQAESGWKVIKGVDFSYRDIRGNAQQARACQQVTLGTRAWNPTAEDPNPAPANAEPVDQNAFCGMVVDRSQTSGPLTSDLTSTAGKPLCLDAAGGKQDNGTQVQVWDCNSSSAQDTVRQSNTLRLNGKCLDAQWSGAANGTRVQLWDCNGSAAQRVTYDATRQTLRLQGKCLTVADAKRERGTAVHLWDCDSRAGQGWLNDTKRERVVCAPAGCFIPSEKEATIGGRINQSDATQARLALLSGLRTPPGAIPAGPVLDNPVWSSQRQMVLLPMYNSAEVWRCTANKADCLATSRTVSLNPTKPYGGVESEFSTRFQRVYMVVDTARCRTKSWSVTENGQLASSCDGRTTVPRIRTSNAPDSGYCGQGRCPEQAKSTQPETEGYPVVLHLSDDNLGISEGAPQAKKTSIWRNGT